MSRKSGPSESARRVLVATDGSRVSASAVKFARCMADTGAWAPRLVTVFEPLPVAVADVALAAPPAEYLENVEHSRLDVVRTAVRRGGGGEWPLRVEYGSAVGGIMEAAREEQATMIALGLGEHGRLARYLGAETAARVVRNADMPVLAVAWGFNGPSFTAVVAIDFGESSVAAAQEAMALLNAPGRLHLVHVRPQFNLMTGPPDSMWHDMYDAAVEKGFRLVREKLGERAGVAITTESVSGGVVDTLLKVASRRRADLVAVGSHNRSALDRLLIGSTPANLLRAAPCSVLVAPPAASRN